jgi:hypothetical protein
LASAAVSLSLTASGDGDSVGLADCSLLSVASREGDADPTAEGALVFFTDDEEGLGVTPAMLDVALGTGLGSATVKVRVAGKLAPATF